MTVRVTDTTSPMRVTDTTSPVTVTNTTSPMMVTDTTSPMTVTDTTSPMRVTNTTSPVTVTKVQNIVPFTMQITKTLCKSQKHYTKHYYKKALKSFKPHTLYTVWSKQNATQTTKGIRSEAAAKLASSQHFELGKFSQIFSCVCVNKSLYVIRTLHKHTLFYVH